MATSLQVLPTAVLGVLPNLTHIHHVTGTWPARADSTDSRVGSGRISVDHLLLGADATGPQRRFSQMYIIGSELI